MRTAEGETAVGPRVEVTLSVVVPVLNGAAFIERNLAELAA